MSTRRKILFALTTTLVLLGILEGAARLIWWRLQERAFTVAKTSGENELRSDTINFMKQADPILGYVLKPGFERGGFSINPDGFNQRDTVPLAKSEGNLRLAALGESTTQGHNVDNANYPLYLRRLIKEHAPNYKNVEMINGGVSGWMSDQVALWADRKIRGYRPDVVVLYVGWNDFQSYDPFGLPRGISYFDQVYGSVSTYVQSPPLKIVALVSAAYEYYSRQTDIRQQRHARKSEVTPLTATNPPQYKSAPSKNYRFFLRSLDRIVSSFQSHDSNIKLAICTLVGRWPDGTEADFQSSQGATWWMKQHRLDAAQSAATLKRFNTLIREYAKTRDLPVIDAEEHFAELDRGKLQWDWAHLTSEGYELLAEVMYDGLRSAGLVNGEPSARFEQLRNKYRKHLRG